ncbi:MAG: tryptophan 7-halogenase [Myxococcales bacterium]|nr:tryptophan 7-halogenase [Myxococcales bacterium]
MHERRWSGAAESRRAVRAGPCRLRRSCSCAAGGRGMTHATTVPERAQVLVVGGGPGGSMAATLLAREGVDVVVLERERFPRYHIGESLLTSVIPVLQFVGLYERMEAHGFVRKHGGFFTLEQGAPPGHIDFRKVSAYRHSYQVIRAEFDLLLLRYAAEQGARVLEEVSVTAIEREGDRPVRARWQRADGTAGSIAFDHLVDASGAAGLMSTRVLRNRHVQPAFANVAVGSYWRGHAPYVSPDGQPQDGDFYMEALHDGSGWAWAIPLHDQTLSVGVVVHVEHFQRMRAEAGDAERAYALGLGRTANVQRMLAAAEQVGPVRVWRDFSYTADAYAGPGFRLVGDAAAFIDPLFSTGVHLAFLGALSAAATIAAELRGEVDPSVAQGFHDRCIRKAYVRFAVIVSGMYKQIRRQDQVVLYGIHRADFRHAFDVILPLVSGHADLAAGDEVDQGTIGRAIDFTIDMMNERAQLGTDNRAARLFIAKAGVHEDLVADPHGAVGGRYIRMERGRLGLAEVGAHEAAIERDKQRLVDELLEAADS